MKLNFSQDLSQTKRPGFLTDIAASTWVRIALVNLLLVALLGILMRYKILFEFPYFDQKHLQEGHSHFAFGGWITHLLITLIFLFLKPFLSARRIRRYHLILLLNLVCAYLMLVSFAIQGYGPYSLLVSTVSILVSFTYVFTCYADLKKAGDHPSIPWLKAALIFNVLSTFGTAVLAYMMASKNYEQHSSLVSVYWYLHFQYNGWFMFACAGILFAYIKRNHPEFQLSKNIFLLFAGSCIPTYGLSVLWLDLPLWVDIIIALAALAQLAGWFKLWIALKHISYPWRFPAGATAKFILSAVALALTLKLLLQAGSTVPAMSKLAFGFRPIVIAYLHLVLLAIISMFLIAYLFSDRLIEKNKISTTGFITFFLGVFLNETVLAIQGIASLGYHVVPFVNEMLLFIAMLIGTGVAFMITGQFTRRDIATGYTD
jgi:hypothetical protein